jgi:hypothetical protein
VNYLLPAQTLLDLCDRRPNRAKTWAQEVDTAALRVSVISVAEAQAEVDGVPDAQARARLDANLNALLSQLRADVGGPLEFHLEHAGVWRALIKDQTIRGLGYTDRQVYATAMYEGVTVVEEPGLHTPALRALGVKIRDL